ncbi:MAG TPA: hypothetical protein VGZ48_07230 [Candidatus Acidoferrales bacterium]|jgi:hypothetical protein|nr:hypothetical protein [Candidatus Acidoferrales bacterium]
MSLKRTVVMLFVLLAAGVGVVKSQTPRPDNRNFWALNNTGKEIAQFYVSPHGNPNWLNNVLGHGVLPAEMGTVIYFPSNVSTGCSFDFKLVYSDGSSQVYQQGRDVCQIYAVQFDPTDSFGLVK